MKVLMLYHPKGEYGRQVEEYAKEYERFKGHKLQLLSLESIKGTETAKLYDVVQYPAILAIDNEGKLLQLWQGLRLPLMKDLDVYLSD